MKMRDGGCRISRRGLVKQALLFTGNILSKAESGNFDQNDFQWMSVGWGDEARNKKLLKKLLKKLPFISNRNVN
jgi:hypothetical protein